MKTVGRGRKHDLRAAGAGFLSALTLPIREFFLCRSRQRAVLASQKAEVGSKAT